MPIIVPHFGAGLLREVVPERQHGQAVGAALREGLSGLGRGLEDHPAVGVVEKEAVPAVERLAHRPREAPARVGAGRVDRHVDRDVLGGEPAEPQLLDPAAHVVLGEELVLEARSAVDAGARSGQAEQVKAGDMMITDGIGIISNILYGPDQRLGLGAVVLFLEVIAHASMQIPGLADVNDGALRVQEQVASGKMRKMIEGDHDWTLNYASGY